MIGEDRMSEIRLKPLWIVQTGVFLALLVVLQWATQPMGQIVTGSVVNFLLIAATLAAGMGSGIVVGLISPFLALLLGIVGMPIYIVPAVALGNITLVLTYGVILRHASSISGGFCYAWWTAAIVCGSLLKFAVLYAGVNWLVVPMVTTVSGAPAKAPAAVSGESQQEWGRLR